MNRLVIGWTLAASISILGIAFIGLSIPMLIGKIPPNPSYGFRTTKTLRNSAVWYAANRVAARFTIICGVAMIGLAMTLMRIARNATLAPQKMSYIGMAFLTVPPVVLVVTLFLYNLSL